MRQFFKMMIASTLGTFIALSAGLFLLVAFLSFLAAMSGRQGTLREIEPNSILSLDLTGELIETTGDLDFGFPGALDILSERQQIGLFELKRAIHQAGLEEQIRGIYLRADGLTGGWASLQSLRRSLEEFKKLGKFVIAYGEGYSESQYFLASVADEIYIYPQGGFELDGLGVTPVFFRGLLEKLDVKPEIFRVGEFKSAVEPFTRQDMSEKSREQMEELLGDLWQIYSQAVTQKTEKSPKNLDGWANDLDVFTAREALNNGLVTDTVAEHQVFDVLRQRTGIGEDEDPKLIPFRRFLTYRPPGLTYSPAKVAVILLSGEIVDGKGDEARTGSDDVVRELRDALKDDSVKAIVLRVNSPGGSALAADVIWKEVENVQEKKPVIASFGDVAASGGYYVAAGAAKIFAEASTITGSIGVFGVRLNAQGLFSKGGITFDRVVTHNYADNEGAVRPLTEYERKKVQSYVENTYLRFLQVVQKGRGYENLDEVRAVGGGRVWSGQRAKELGLVDEIAGLDEAVKAVVEMAGLKGEPEVEMRRPSKHPLEQLLKFLGAEASLFSSLRSEMIPEIFKAFRPALERRWESGIYARMPMDIEIN